MNLKTEFLCLHSKAELPMYIDFQVLFSLKNNKINLRMSSAANKLSALGLNPTEPCEAMFFRLATV